MLSVSLKHAEKTHVRLVSSRRRRLAQCPFMRLLLLRATHQSFHYSRRSAMDPSLLARSVSVPLLLILAVSLPGSPTASSCSDSEKAALLRLKSRLGDPGDRFTSWTSPDCCSWTGVTCDNVTGAIVKLDLQHSETLDDKGSSVDVHGKLTGELDPALLELKSLAYLDLSYNDLADRPIPSWLGSMSQLKYLGLSGAGFAGVVPPQLGNLSALEHLDMESSVDGSRTRLYFESFKWVSGLTSLRSLLLSWVDLSNLDSAEIIQTLNDNLPSLADLQFIYCNLSRLPSSVPSLKLASLTSLDLSYSDIGPEIPPWIFNISSLVNLNLQGCGFQGPLPEDLSRLSNLVRIFLSFNNFSGSLPPSVGKLCKLEVLYLDFNSLDREWPQTLESADDSSCTALASLLELDVAYNKIPGPLPAFLENLETLMYFRVESNLFAGAVPLGIRKLPNMTMVYAANNRLAGEITEDHLSGTKSLRTLDLGNNSGIRMNLRPDWTPPFQLERLMLSGCRVGPRFPSWIKNQERLEDLDLSRGGISDEIPSWFWGFSRSLDLVDLSSNLIHGEISEKVSGLGKLSTLNFSGNRFSGRIPSSMASMQIDNLDLSNNNFSGEVPLPDFFNATTLHGNPLLCGPPTNVNCQGDREVSGPATRRWSVKGNPSFCLGMAVGAAAGILVTLAIGSYLWRSLLQRKDAGEMMPVYFQDLKKDAGMLGK